MLKHLLILLAVISIPYLSPAQTVIPKGTSYTNATSDMIAFTPLEVQRMLLWKQKADLADSLATELPLLLNKVKLQTELIDRQSLYILDLEAQYKKVYAINQEDQLKLKIYRYSSFTLAGVVLTLLIVR